MSDTRHRDPFDRMLACRAIAHGLAIATSDPEVCRYPIRIVWWESRLF